LIIIVLSVATAHGCTTDTQEEPAQTAPAPTRTIASPPTATEELGTPGLTRDVPRRVGRICDRTRRLVSIRVICPDLIPAVPLSAASGGSGPLPLGDDAYMLSFTTAEGEDDRPLTGAVDHWITGGGKTETVRTWLLTDAFNESPGSPTLVRTLTAKGRRVLVYRYPTRAGGPNMGHWAAFVELKEEMVFASLHGRQYVEAAVAMAVDLAVRAARH
jgi:hypothetical protein